MLFTKLRQLIKEAYDNNAHDAAIDLIKHTIAGTEFENNAYIAGGFVRDELLGKKSKDIDVVVDLKGDMSSGIKMAEFLAKQFGVFKQGSNPVTFPTFGTAQLNLAGLTHKGISLDGVLIEFVAPRKEKYSDERGRKPIVSASTLQDDAERRDFTINSLMKNLSTGEILDLTGMGKKDLEKRIIRTPLDPDIIFHEDPLRLLRAVRFAAKYGFDLPSFMLRSIKKNAAMLSTISHERIREELGKMLLTDKPSRAVRLLKLTGLLQQFLPEIQKLSGLTQGAYHDKDAFKHTLNVLDSVPADMQLRLAALFHDIGKALTKTDDNSKIHFIGHAEIGADLAADVMRRLKYSNNDIDKIKKLVRLHMDTKSGGKQAESLKDSHLRKLVHQAGEMLEPLLSLIHADNISHASHESMPEQVDKIRERIKGWDLQRIIDAKLPINGQDLVDLNAPKTMRSKIINRIRKHWLKRGDLSREQALQIASDMIKSDKNAS